MKRYITKALLKWKNSDNRKPLILNGVRQCGKTYTLVEFGEKYYDNYVLFDFERDSNLCSLFDNDLNPENIIDRLRAVSSKPIIPEKTLIIFDEIQACSRALTSLKYFCDEAPCYHIVAAGSLLGITLSDTNYPDGKVDTLEMFPMSFSEFLIAEGKENLVEYISKLTINDKIDNMIEKILIEKLKFYFIIGGMPEVVYSWETKRNFSEVDRIQRTILEGYKKDFGKHTTKAQAIKIELVYDSVVSQLGKDNKKFIYNAIKSGARAREYEYSLNWLNNTYLITKVYNISKPESPLSFYEQLEDFKIYLSDVGLLRRKANLNSKIILNENSTFTEFKGALTENYICNVLRRNIDSIDRLHYYTFNQYEIDYILEYEDKLLPLEIKSGRSNNHRSMTVYNEKNNNEISIRLSLDNIKKDGKIINIPLYLAEYISNFIG